MAPVIRPAILFETSLVLVAALAARVFGVRVAPLLEASWELLGIGVIAAAPPLAVFWWTQRSGFAPLVALRTTVQTRVVPLFRGASRWELLVLAVAAGVGEELLFRGVAQTGIGQATTPGVGLLAGALLFGLAHFVTRTYAVLAAIIGLYLGALTLLTASLLPATVAHATYDFVAILLLLRASASDGDAPGTG